MLKYFHKQLQGDLSETVGTVVKRDTLLANRAADAEEQARTIMYGPAPTNPFASLRMGHSLSLEQLAKESYIDAAALLRAEQGLYSNPLPSLLEYWSRRGQSEYILTNDYEDFQNRQRLRHQMYFGESLNKDLSTNDEHHPFRQLRACRVSLVTHEILPVGLVECSKALCLPLDTLQFFEKKFKTQQSVPKSLKAVLNFIGYSPFEISEFETIYKTWRSNQINSKWKFK